MSNLKKLDLSNNKLQSLPYEINHLTHLTHLYLSTNYLTNIPELNLYKLRHLSLSNNQLSKLPSLNNLT